MRDKMISVIITALVILVVCAMIALSVIEVVAQFKYSGEFIEWRWVPIRWAFA